MRLWLWYDISVYAYSGIRNNKRAIAVLTMGPNRYIIIMLHDWCTPYSINVFQIIMLYMRSIDCGQLGRSGFDGRRSHCKAITAVTILHCYPIKYASPPIECRESDVVNPIEYAYVDNNNSNIILKPSRCCINRSRTRGGYTNIYFVYRILHPREITHRYNITILCQWSNFYC